MADIVPPMCGRYSLATGVDVLKGLFGVGGETPALPPRWNVAPTQPVAVVVVTNEARRALRTMRWGLIPSWAKDPAIGNRMINARAETVAVKPSFRAALRARRCLVLADGFYEWQRLPSRRKQPWLVRMRDGSPFAFGGLWESWRSPDGRVLESCVILTTAPNALLATIHDRMPLILRPEDHALWLDPEVVDPARLLPLLVPFPPDEMEAVRVSSRVNDPSLDDPGCAEPLPEVPEP
jgi:putative SOS response-associated peptidase YedK